MRSRLKVKVEKRAASRRGHEGREQNQATNCNLTTHEFKQASHDQEEGHDARQHHDGGLEDRDLVGAAAGHRRGKWRRREGEVLFSLRSMTLGQRRKKKECPRVSRGKERRTKQKQKQASKQEKKTPLSHSFTLLTVEKKKQAKQAEKKRRAASLHPSSSNLSQSLSTKMRFALLFLALCVAVLASMVRPLEAIVGFGCARARILFSLFSL